ncbi:MAG: ATP-binding protein [Clostridiaceae bacterium]|jgi:serine/threonine-protein kinase RsbW|nr:ATP-binding protein [Clostridiaceae bacterium]
MVMQMDYNQDTKIYSEDIPTDAYVVCNEVRNILDMLQRRYLLDAEQCFDIKVILCELLQNSIKHGNVSDVSKKIRVEIWLKEASRVLGITIKDQGRGFQPVKTRDFSLAKPLDCNPVNMDESGRGLLIVNELCDCMEFNTMGNAITVLKRI